MKRHCLVCHTDVADAHRTCPRCGEASWQPIQVKTEQVEPTRYEHKKVKR